MLKPATIEALTVLCDRLEIERLAITEAMESIKNLLRLEAEDASEVPPHQRCSICQAVDHRAPTCPKTQTVVRAKDHPRRGLPVAVRQKPKRRCSKCRSDDHRISHCPQAVEVERVEEQLQRVDRQRQREAIPAPPPEEPGPSAADALSWLKPSATSPKLELAPPEADGRVRACPIHGGRLSIARLHPNGRPVYMCTLGHETTQSLLQEPRG